MIKGVLFDMDGVLADSEEFICRAAILMFEELGFKVEPDDFKPFVGTGENSYIGGVARKYGIPVEIEKVKARTYEIYQAIIKGNLKPLPGAAEMVSGCRKIGLKLALATSADRIKMESTLNETGIPASSFDAIITGLDVVNKKPYPDIYINAARKLGLETYECLVVEDAISGITAAKRAGCKCLAVATSFAGELLSEADWICESLEKVPGEALKW